MKGIALPTEAIVVIVLVILVLAVIGVFFLTSSGGSINTAEAQRVFADGCIQACKDPCDFRYKAGLGRDVTENDFYKKFAQACVQLGHASATTTSTDSGSVRTLLGDIRTCVAACGKNCDVSCPVTPPTPLR